MDKVTVMQARAQMAEVVNRVAFAGERIVLERHGKDVAALVSIDDLRLLERLEDELDVAAALAAKKEGGKPIPLETLAAELGVKLPKRGGRSGKPHRRAAG